MSIIVQEPAVGQDSSLILLPGAEVCETREFSARICFQARYAGSRITFWHNAWFPTKRVLIKEAGGVRMEAEFVQAALDFLFRQNGHRYEAVLEDRGQRPGDAR
jgi:hypothetical protein